eukprot:SM000056S17999  [mRNA]  locus=s56:595732:596950:+ [translate_table: standard]
MQLLSGMAPAGRSAPMAAALPAATAGQAQFLFAEVDAPFTSEDMPLLPSGFRAVSLESPPPPTQPAATSHLHPASLAVLVIAFQYAYSANGKAAVESMARHHVRHIVTTVQRITAVLRLPPAPPLALLPLLSPGQALLAQRAVCSHRAVLGVDLPGADVASPIGGEQQNAIGDGKAVAAAEVALFWRCKHAIVLCEATEKLEVAMANAAGLEMLGAPLGGLRRLDWDDTHDAATRIRVLSALPQLFSKGFAMLPAGRRVCADGRIVAYNRATAWKVSDGNTGGGSGGDHIIAFLHYDWAFLPP